MRILTLFLVASGSACFGASIMALLIAGAREDRKMERCATCKHYPQPDGIAHLCEYWGKLTNSEQSCSNWREKDGSDKPRD